MVEFELTPRQREVLDLAAQRYTSREIAEILVLSCAPSMTTS